MKVVNKYNHIPTNKDIYIGRGSIFGNPFVINNHSNRQEVINKYKIYLKENILLQNAIKKLDKDSILVCFCKPKDCHGDIIKEYYESIKLNNGN